jgi:hypothetical protein
MAALGSKLETLRDSLQGYENESENMRTRALLTQNTVKENYKSDAFNEESCNLTNKTCISFTITTSYVKRCPVSSTPMRLA